MSVEATPPTRLASSMREGSYVDWASVIAGAVTAAALSGLLLTFGSGVGLSLVSPFTPDSNVSTMTLLAIVAAWTILVYVGSYAAGGYIAGRMRRPWNDADSDEVVFRDGVHGLLVWAVGVIVSAMVVSSSAGQAVSTATALGGSAATLDYAVDNLLRPAPGQGPQQNAQTNRTALRDEARRLLTAVGTSAPATSAQGAGQGGSGAGQAGQVQQQANADRTYLAQLVASYTGLSAQEAEQRVSQVVERARAATEQARRVGIIAAFLTAASLLVSAVAAWYAATSGGEHRERGILWPGAARRRLPDPTST